MATARLPASPASCIGGIDETRSDYNDTASPSLASNSPGTLPGASRATSPGGQSVSSRSGWGSRLAGRFGAGSEAPSEGVRQRVGASASVRSSSPASSTCTVSRNIDRQGEGKAKKLRRYVLQKHDHVERAAPTGCEQDDVGRLALHLHGAFGLPNVCRFGTVQPYAVVTVGDSTMRTSTITGEINPAWDEKMIFPVIMPADGSPINVAIEVWHDSYTKNELISSSAFEVFRSFPGDGPCEERFRVVSLQRPKCEDGGMIRYSLSLTSVEKLQDRARRLDKMNKIPFLPEFVMFLNHMHAELWAFKDVVMENWRSMSVFSTIYLVAATPVRVVRSFVRSVIRKLATWML